MSDSDVEVGDEARAHAVIDPLIHGGYLAELGHDEHSGAPLGWWLRTDGSGGGFEYEGRYYLPLDVSRLPPLYQEIYWDVVIERLRRSGLGDGTGVVCLRGLVLAWAPTERMREARPSRLAAERLWRGDEGWVAGLDEALRHADERMEQQADAVWAELQHGRASPESVTALIEAKASLNALALDSLVPRQEVMISWLTPHVGSGLAGELLDASLLPSTGYVAYDIYEDECWRLAGVLASDGEVSGAARQRFIQRGLFFQFETLDTNRAEYYFGEYPGVVASRFIGLAPGPGGVASRRDELRQRDWRRRLHRACAAEHLAAGPRDAVERDRLLVLHRFLGLARDFDEDKRRLNFKFWRNLVALADGLGVHLPTSTRQDLCESINRHGGQVALNSALIEEGGSEQ